MADGQANAAPSPPGGWSWSHFKAVCADVGSWTWGTVQGAFNEKASFSQILVDAVIGMIPLVGDATAVRDLIAVIIGLIDDPKKRESTWEWVLFVVLLLALVPVLGGVAKGVGRILCKVFSEAAKLRGAARLAHIAEGAKEIVAFLNRIGVKNAEKWLKSLRFAEYQAQILERFGALMNTLSVVLKKVTAKMGSLMPAGLGHRIEALQQGIAQLKAKGNEMIPLAIKELDQDLRELQAYVRSGGETTSRIALHEVATGQRVVTRADEARLVEDGVLPARSTRGGWKQNEAVLKKPNTWGGYKPEPGYPDLTKNVVDDKLPWVAAYSGRIVNRELKQGEEIYRLFGPKGVTHGVLVDPTKASGAWWGLGKAPTAAREWREHAAVLDEFNRDGFIVIGKVIGAKGPKAAVGTVSEQAGTKLSGQYLGGGTTQALFFTNATSADHLKQLGEQVIKSGKSETWVDTVEGITYEIRPTNWNDANGIWGYLHMPGSGKIQTARLGAREVASKKNDEVTVTP